MKMRCPTVELIIGKIGKKLLELKWQIQQVKGYSQVIAELKFLAVTAAHSPKNPCRFFSGTHTETMKLKTFNCFKVNQFTHSNRWFCETVEMIIHTPESAMP